MADTITPARFTAMAQSLAADTRDAPNAIRQTEALKLLVQALRSIGYGPGCDAVDQMLNGGRG